jgi:hypothetical protein
MGTTISVFGAAIRSESGSFESAKVQVATGFNVYEPESLLGLGKLGPVGVKTDSTP